MYEPGDILAGIAARAGMDVAKQLPGAIISATVAEEWVVVEDYRLIPYANAHLLSHLDKFGGDRLRVMPVVVVAHHQINMPVEPSQD